MLWWRQALDVLINGPADPVVVPRPPRNSPWTLEERSDARSEAALSLLDPDVCGFFLLTFHRDESDSHICVSHVVEADWWDPIAAAVGSVRPDGEEA